MMREMDQRQLTYHFKDGYYVLQHIQSFMWSKSNVDIIQIRLRGQVKVGPE